MTARTTTPRKKPAGFTDEEKSAMRMRIKELQSDKDKSEGESVVLAKIDELSEPDRALAKRIHSIVKASAPNLTPRLWYGMPAYEKSGKIICHFQGAYKFKTRYATIAFGDSAKLDDGAVWPVAYALTKLSAADEAKIGALIKKAAG